MADLQALLNRIDLRALVEEAGAVFGHNNSCVCPLHPGADNPAAFRIYIDRDGRQRWHCFTRCPDGENDGDAISFYMRWRGVDFKAAVQELAQRDGEQRISPGDRIGCPTQISQRIAAAIEPPDSVWRARAQEFVEYARVQLRLPAGQAALEYLHRDRGLTDDTIRAWQLGYNPRDCWDEPARWGLKGSRRVWLSRGIVIPSVRNGVLWYIKVRRPLPGDALAQGIGAVERLPEVKFGGPRGGRATLFGADRLTGLPVLLLTEGEFDAMLAWQGAVGLCDVATLGGARHRLDVLDAVALTQAWTILAVYDLDDAGKEGDAYLQTVSRRVKVIRPPAHDFTDYWQQGGDLQRWIAGLVAEQMEQLLDQLDERQHPELFVKWLAIYEKAMCRQAGER